MSEIVSSDCNIRVFVGNVSFGSSFGKKSVEESEGCMKPEEFLSVTYWLEL